jgi:hypothetical protein
MKSTTDGHRHFTIAQRLQVSSEQVVRMKDSCSRMRKHSAGVCVSLRRSAAENVFNRRRTPTFVRPTWPAKNAKPFGQVRSWVPDEVPGTYDWFLIAKREHFLAPEVPELKIYVCAGLRESAAENEFNRRRTPTFVRPTWPAKNAKPSGQVGSAAPGDVLDKLRLIPHREAIAHFSSAGRGAKKPCSRMRKHSAPVCVSLRVSAAKKPVRIFYREPE